MMKNSAIVALMASHRLRDSLVIDAKRSSLATRMPPRSQHASINRRYAPSSSAFRCMVSRRKSPGYQGIQVSGRAPLNVLSHPYARTARCGPHEKPARRSVLGISSGRRSAPTILVAWPRVTSIGLVRALADCRCHSTAISTRGFCAHSCIYASRTCA